MFQLSPYIGSPLSICGKVSIGAFNHYPGLQTLEHYAADEKLDSVGERHRKVRKGLFRD